MFTMLEDRQAHDRAGFSGTETPMRCSVAVLLAGLLAPAATNAQSIVGVVREHESRLPIGGANITLFDAGNRLLLVARTDTTGNFIVRPASGGRFRVLVTHPSYVNTRTDTITLGPAENLALELVLVRSAIALEPVTATARSNARNAGFYRRMEAGQFGFFMDRSDIDQRATMYVTDIVRGTGGVRIVPVRRTRGSPTVDLIAMEGAFGQCLPTIVIDGIKVQQYAEAGLNDLLKPDLIEGVEIYPRNVGAPQQYIEPNSNCGLVAFWTRAEPWGGRSSWKKAAAVLFVVSVTTLLAR